MQPLERIRINSLFGWGEDQVIYVHQAVCSIWRHKCGLWKIVHHVASLILEFDSLVVRVDRDLGGGLKLSPVVSGVGLG